MFGIVHSTKRIWRHPANRGRRLRSLARAAWWKIRGAFTSRPLEIELFGGSRIFCWPDSGVTKGLVSYSGRPEYHEMGLVAHLLRPGDRFVDVGANIGYYSLLAAGIVGATGAVEAFEPGRTALGRLRENLALNRFWNVRVHEAAATDASGTVGYTSGLDTADRLAAGADASGTTVAAVRLDDVLRDLPCALGKMDIEGAEPLALQGALALLARFTPPVWILEMTKRVRDYGFTEEGFAAWLDKLGYDLGLYDADLRQFRFPQSPWKECRNVIAVSRASRVEVSLRVLDPLPQK